MTLAELPRAIRDVLTACSSIASTVNGILKGAWPLGGPISTCRRVVTLNFLHFLQARTIRLHVEIGPPSGHAPFKIPFTVDAIELQAVRTSRIARGNSAKVMTARSLKKGAMFGTVNSAGNASPSRTPPLLRPPKCPLDVRRIFCLKIAPNRKCPLDYSNAIN